MKILLSSLLVMMSFGCSDQRPEAQGFHIGDRVKHIKDNFYDSCDHGVVAYIFSSNDVAVAWLNCPTIKGSESGFADTHHPSQLIKL